MVNKIKKKIRPLFRSQLGCNCVIRVRRRRQLLLNKLSPLLHWGAQCLVIPAVPQALNWKLVMDRLHFSLSVIGAIWRHLELLLLSSTAVVHRWPSVMRKCQIVSNFVVNQFTILILWCYWTDSRNWWRAILVVSFIFFSLFSFQCNYN